MESIERLFNMNDGNRVAVASHIIASHYFFIFFVFVFLFAVFHTEAPPYIISINPQQHSLVINKRKGRGFGG